MKIFSTFCLLLGFTITNAKNLPDNLYDVIINQCSSFDLTDTSFKNQAIFQKCKNWQTIKETKELNEETKVNVLCLLYYDSFMSFCNDIKLIKTTNITVNLVPDVKDYKIDKICKIMPFSAGKKFEFDIDKIISGEGICYKLCLNFDGTVVPECSLAHYFVNYNISQLIQGAVVNSKQPETSISEIKPGPPGEPVDTPKGSVPQKETIQEDNSKKLNEAATDGDKSVGSLQNPSENAPVGNPDTSVSTPVLQESKNISKSTIIEQAQPAAKSNPTLNNADNTNIEIEKDEPEKSKSPENISEKIQQENTPVDAPVQGNEEKPEMELTVDHPNLDQVDAVELDDQNEEDMNDGNYKDEEEKQDNENVLIVTTKEKKKEKPNTLTLTGGVPANYNTVEDMDGESYFFSYFMVICVLFVLGYVGYHNRQKVMALMLEGKRGKRQVRNRRPNSANYHKLDSNLEEAISSTCTKNSSHVIY